MDACAPTSAAAVANTFLDLQAEDVGNFPKITPLKLQKLLYYAQAWWLAIKETPLFDEEIYAWPWGPVIPHIYGEFRHFGRDPIDGERATELVKSGEGPFGFSLRTPPEPNNEVKAFLKSVWDSHKQFSPVQLSNASHMPGEPWALVKNQYQDLESKPVIPNALIMEVFKSKLQK